MTLEDIRDDCGWQGAGKPQWIMLDAVKDMLVAIQSGLLPPSELTSDFGYNIRDNLDDLLRTSIRRGRVYRSPRDVHLRT